MEGTGEGVGRLAAQAVGCGTFRWLLLHCESPSSSPLSSLALHELTSPSSKQRRPQVVPFAYILPSADVALAKSAWEPFTSYTESHPNTKLNITFVETRTWFELYKGGE